MKIGRQQRARTAGFNLFEVAAATLVVGVLAYACLSAFSLSRVQRMRDREQGIVGDFLLHYVEHLKALPFDDLTGGRPLNALYDGQGGGPRITIPANASWGSLTNTNYLVFHPDLVWLRTRAPELRVTLQPVVRSGQTYAKHVRVECKWVQPLTTDRMLTNRLDLMRVKEL